MLGAVAAGAPAVAREPEPAPPMVSSEAAPRPPRRAPWRPIEWFYRPVDIERQNVGAWGRMNATADEQRISQTPSLQPPPLTGWGW
jgi:hypothetical protein